MGTKNKPGQFDCYHKADPDEPVFVLLGRDPAACLAVLFWVRLRQDMDAQDPKLLEARLCARQMEAYTRQAKGHSELQRAMASFRSLLGGHPPDAVEER